MNFLLDYCIKNHDQDDEIEELLHEVVLLIGYSVYKHTKNQELASRGHANNTMLSKLLSMPYKYFMGNRIERELLFPTLISIVYLNDYNYSILLKEMSSELLIEYIETNIQTWSSAVSLGMPELN